MTSLERGISDLEAYLETDPAFSQGCQQEVLTQNVFATSSDV